MNQLHLPFLKQVQGWNKKPYKDTVNKNFVCTSQSKHNGPSLSFFTIDF